VSLVWWVVAALATLGAGGASRMGYIESEPGVRLYYEIHGGGEATLLVPNALYLERDFAALARGRRVAFYDLRHRGRSEPVTDPDLLARGVWHDVEDMEAVRRAVGAERISLLGHSYLGVAVVLYALEHPERVERLVLVGPAPPRWGTGYPPELTAAEAPPPVSPERLAALEARDFASSDQPARDCREWQEVMSRFLVGDPERYRDVLQDWCRYPNERPVSLLPHLVGNVIPSLEKLEISQARLDRVTAPALVVHGTWDRNAPYGGGREWAWRLPRARLLTVPQAGHVPWIESPGVVDAIDAFLAGTWPAKAEAIAAPRR
jgi:proline iminopeptidase